MTTTIYEPTSDWPRTTAQIFRRHPMVFVWIFALAFAVTCNGC